MGKPLVAAVAALCVIAGIVATVLLFVLRTPGPQAAPPSEPPEVESASARTEPEPEQLLETDADRAVERTQTSETTLPVANPADPPAYVAGLCGVRGRLVEEDGTPVPHTRVELLELEFSTMTNSLDSWFEDGSGREVELSVGQAISAEDGTFAMRGARAIAFHALAVDPAGPRATARVLDHALIPGADVDLGDIVLGSFVTFAGRIVDESGTPVAGARVRATNVSRMLILDGLQNVRGSTSALIETGNDRAVLEVPDRFAALEHYLPLPTTHSESDGAFELAGVPPGLVTLAVDTPGTAGTLFGPRPTGKRERTEVGDVVLRAGRTVQGVVVDTAGDPVPNCEVLVTTALSVPVVSLGETVRTNADGSFVASGALPSGALQVAARRNRAHAWTFAESVAEIGNVEIVLDLRGAIVVDCRDEHGRPLDDVEFRVHAVPSDRDFREILSMNMARALATSTERLAPGRWRLDSLPPGSYSVVARAAGYADSTANFQIPEDSEAQLDFGPASLAVVRVVAEIDGAAVEGAHVVAAKAGFSDQFTELARARTDSDGRAELPRLQASESLQLRIDHSQYASLGTLLTEEAFTGGEQVVTLSIGGEIHGTVLDHGEPPGQPLMLLFERWGGENSHPNEEMPRFVVPDAEGSFRLAGLGAGEWHYAVFDRFLDADPLQFLPSLLPSGPSEHVSGGCEVVAGEVTELAIDLDPALRGAVCVIHGVVRAPGLPPSTEITVGASGRESEAEVVVTNGSPYELRNLMPERLEVSATIEGGHGGSTALAHESVSLSPQEQRRIDFELVAEECQIRIVDRNGQPTAAAVSLQPHNTPGMGQAWRYHTQSESDASGVARFVLPIPGDYRIDANGASGVCTVDAALPDDRLTLTLDPGVPCSGVVVDSAEDADQARFRHITFALQNDDSSHARGAGLDSDLEFEILGLAPGRYQVTLHRYGNDYSTSTAELVLPANGNENIRLEFR